MIFRSPLVLASLIGLMPNLVGDTTESAELQRYAHSHFQMGTKFDLVVYGESAEQAKRAFTKASRRVDALNASMSDYKRDSEVSRLSQSAGKNMWRTVTDPLWHVMTASQRLASLTEGAFDITAGPLTKQWRTTLRTNKLPHARRLKEALAATGYVHLKTDSDRRRVR